MSDFRFTPQSRLKSDIAGCPKSAKNGSGAFLFKDLVGAGEKGRRDFDTKRFRRFEIDGKQEFGGLLNRKLSRFGAFQNSIDIVGAATRQGEQVRAVRNQSACLHKLSEQVNRR